MKKHTWKEKFQYRFDNMMSRGTVSLIVMLFGITLFVVLLAGILVAVLQNGGDGSLGKSLWISLMHTLDPGTLAEDNGNWFFLLLMTIVTICGLFITSMLIGILNAGLENKLTSLRKGKSLILEENHVVVLGFNEYAINIISELILANENHKNQVVVVMDNREKTEMEDIIHQRIPNTKTTRIICRSGLIDNATDLAICSLETCRSIILNVPDDTVTIKALLACVNVLEASDNDEAYITAIIRNPENLKAAEIASDGRAEILYFRRTIARLMAHVTRQPGISSVFTNLLSYEGDEIYVEDLPGSEGLTVEELNMRLSKSTAIGIATKTLAKINPPQDQRVGPGDRVILIEEDDGVTSLNSTAAIVKKDVFSELSDVPNIPYRCLILGNGKLLELVLSELDNYVAPGSVIIVANTEWNGRENIASVLNLKNMSLEQETCNIYTSAVLEKLLEIAPEHVMILTDDDMPDDSADAHTLLLLLLLSNIAEQKGLEFTVASEMRKVEDEELAKMTKVNDFVVSSNITALMMTQISQDRRLRFLLEDLLDDEGSEFYRKPITRYVECGKPVDFYTVTAAAARYGEVAIGYQKVEGNKYYNYCNPNKADLITFSPDDALMVIAEN